MLTNLYHNTNNNIDYDIEIFNIPQTRDEIKNDKDQQLTHLDIETLLFEMNDCFRKTLLYTSNKTNDNNTTTNNNDDNRLKVVDGIIAAEDSLFMCKEDNNSISNKDFEYGETLSIYLSKVLLIGYILYI